MTKREKFMMFVYLGAIARDVARDTNRSQGVAQHAARIPEASLPDDAMEASEGFLKFMDGEVRPKDWMC